MGIIWMIIIGFVAGVIAKLVTPESNEPSGLILTTILGIACVCSSLRGWVKRWGGIRPAGSGAGFIGAVLVLLSCC